VAPDLRDFDDEIRGHMALSIKERIERGEDPQTARQAALREFGNVLLTRESMQEVWRPRWRELLEAWTRDLRIALRSLRRARGLALTVTVTLALGIGANAAVFSVVRQVLFRPLVNRGEDRIVYVRQSAPGLGTANTTFSMVEIRDIEARAKTISAFGDFSTIDFTMNGFGEPRVVKAGVVNGSYFDVMGLRPVLGRLVNRGDEGPDAAPVAVLTHRFWSAALRRDPAVVGRTVRLGSRTATVIGVLEPSLPYPADTEIIANVATSPHHLGATMVDERTHRMTELFGRLAPGATLADARRELEAIHAAMVKAHPEAYSARAHVQLAVTLLRDQLTAPARTVLLLLLAAAALVFAIACSNVANLILARGVQRDKELAVRTALGAGEWALRRTLLAESVLLCGGGAVLGVLLARPFVSLVARFAARFSVRALDVSVDSSLLIVGAGLAGVAAIVLAYVPRLPSPLAQARFGPVGAGLRITPGTRGRLRVFAVTQVALSFVLLTGAGMLLAAIVALQTANTGLHLRQVLALDVPLPIEAFGPKSIAFYQEVIRRVERLPGVQEVAVGTFTPWRDDGNVFPRFPFRVEGYTPADGEEDPHARFRIVTPGFFSALGVPLLSGRDFTEGDRLGKREVVIVSESVARRLFPNGDAVNRRFWWTDPMFKRDEPCRIVGVVGDVDDESVVPGPALTVYHPLAQMGAGGRLFVHTAGDPYALVTPVTRIIREISSEQPVERAATLADVRAEVLAPERLNAFVLSGFAAVALLIAVVGVAGVLAFSVSARTREFGIRLAVGSAPRQLLAHVLLEGATIAAIGILAGAAGGFALGRVAAGAFEHLRLPGLVPLLGSAAVLMSAAVAASLMPAWRASRVDVVQALRTE
jgi:putative ABC transport system permease protein